MKRVFFQKKNSILLMIVIGMIMTAILAVLPTGYEDALIYQDMERATAEIIDIDNSAIKSSGLIQSGEQSLSLIHI